MPDPNVRAATKNQHFTWKARQAAECGYWPILVSEVGVTLAKTWKLDFIRGPEVGGGEGHIWIPIWVVGLFYSNCVLVACEKSPGVLVVLDDNVLALETQFFDTKRSYLKQLIILTEIKSGGLQQIVYPKFLMSGIGGKGILDESFDNAYQVTRTMAIEQEETMDLNPRTL